MSENNLWKCLDCGQEFVRKNQSHSCLERSVQSFLEGKSDDMIALFYHIVDEYHKLGNVVLHPAKSQIGFASGRRFAFIPRIGKTFIDLALVFHEAHEDNYCFYRIGQVPDTNKFVHYIRFEHPDDLNDEVRKYMKASLELAQSR